MNFFSKKPQERRKVTGLSKKTVIPKKPTIAAPKTPSALKPYFEIIKEDIKRVFRIDEESRMRKQEYQDFMEQFFGGK